MTAAEFAEALSRLASEAEDAGLFLPAMIERCWTSWRWRCGCPRASGRDRMTKLPDAVPVTPKQAHVWAQSLLGDLTYEDALAVAQALLATTTASYRARWPINGRNARVLHDALVSVAKQRHH